MMPRTTLVALLLVLALLGAPGAAAQALPGVELPPRGIRAQTLGIVVNKLDPHSVRIGRMYRKLRGVPEENVFTVSFLEKRERMEPETLRRIRQEVWDAAGEDIQALLLTWDMPYIVDCMSVTSAFTFGYDTAYCAKGCKPTRQSRYVDSETQRPFSELGIRPTMALTLDPIKAEKLVDRSVEGDGSWPPGTAYLLETDDRNRNVRKVHYPAIERAMRQVLKVDVRKAQSLEDADDVMFLFTGIARFNNLDTNTFLPGAAADNLTSGSCHPGPLPAPGKRPRRHIGCRDFLEAGATGSYGTVVEPCNFLGKFSHPGVLIQRYLRGETLLEAYWKSVVMPGQGMFVGDPLARPYGGARVRKAGGGLVITTRELAPGSYDVLTTDTGAPPYTVLARNIRVDGYPQTLAVPATSAAHLVVRKAAGSQ